jgi:hypothetical protein
MLRSQGQRMRNGKKEDGKQTTQPERERRPGCDCLPASPCAPAQMSCMPSHAFPRHSRRVAPEHAHSRPSRARSEHPSIHHACELPLGALSERGAGGGGGSVTSTSTPLHPPAHLLQQFLTIKRTRHKHLFQFVESPSFAVRRLHVCEDRRQQRCELKRGTAVLCRCFAVLLRSRQMNTTL